MLGDARATGRPVAISRRYAPHLAAWSDEPRATSTVPARSAGATERTSFSSSPRRDRRAANRLGCSAISDAMSSARALTSGRHLVHPFTAPAVRPPTIGRWTIRKKITTGSAKRVHDAIRPP